ncbi:glycerate kinase [Virgibacillus flavescens]|uniref:glycerate kinase n=1 Tax=Virgibacillus flavescens TaxID=1611422 RepID=UPI003D359416
MKNIVIAPDSFKDSLTALTATKIMKRAVIEVLPTCQVVQKPMADGGEGTLEALLESSKGVRVPIRCKGALGEEIEAAYGIVNEGTAIIDCATIAGLTQIPLEKRNPDFTTSYGVGEAMLDALEKGCTSFIFGLGGSATNDGGIGMLEALGMKAWRKNGSELKGYGSDLLEIHKISLDGLDSRLRSVTIQVACDVDNPLCGLRGASEVYGPQKGATADQVKKYDRAMTNFADLLEDEVKESYRDVAGAGAAGGLGFAMLTIGASLVSGAKLIGDAAGLEKAIKHADLVITGEGQSDQQTLDGKAPGYIAMLAQSYGVPIVLISGSLSGNLDLLRAQFTGCFSIINKPLSLEACIENADELLFEQTKSVIHFMNELL